MCASKWKNDNFFEWASPAQRQCAGFVCLMRLNQRTPSCVDLWFVLRKRYLICIHSFGPACSFVLPKSWSGQNCTIPLPPPSNISISFPHWICCCFSVFCASLAEANSNVNSTVLLCHIPEAAMFFLCVASRRSIYSRVCALRVWLNSFTDQLCGCCTLALLGRRSSMAWRKNSTQKKNKKRKSFLLFSTEELTRTDAGSCFLSSWGDVTWNWLKIFKVSASEAGKVGRSLLLRFWCQNEAHRFDLSALKSQAHFCAEN